MSSDTHHSIADCLRDLGVTPEHLADCESLDQEFSRVKKIYYAKMLQDHPDKGGDPETARKNITAWEVLRELKAKGKLKSLTHHLTDNVDDAYNAAYDAAFTTEGGIPCYEHYYEAASVPVPGYKVEMAKSARSQCVACKKGTGTCLKKQMAKAAAAARGEVEEPKKPKAKKGKKKRGAKEDAAGDVAEEDSKPPPRKRGRKKKAAAAAAEEEEPAKEGAEDWIMEDVDGSTNKADDSGDSKQAAAATKNNTKEEEPTTAADDAKPAATTTTPQVAEDSKPPPPRRSTRARKAKSEAMTAIVTTTATNKKKESKKAPAAASKKKITKKAPPAAAAAASSTAVALPASSTAIVDASNPDYILKDTIRVGSLDENCGSYGRWHHLPCWRVPYRVWAGLSKPDDAKQTLFELLRLDEVLLTGLTALSEEDQAAFCAHVMDKSHWARKTKASKPPPSFAEATAVAPAAAASASASAAAAAAPSLNADAKEFVPVSSTSTALAPKLPPQKTAFIIPVPGVDGAIPGCLEGQRFVLTGTFPEVGGGSSLNLGKDKVKAMIEAFGGKVTGSVSGKTNVLIVGKDPGRSKVTKANDRGIPRVDLMAMQNRLYGRIESLENAEQAVITNFSAGYQPAGFLEN